MNCFGGMDDQRKGLSIISTQDHYQRFSSSQTSDTPRGGSESFQNLISGSVKQSCEVVITTPARCHGSSYGLVNLSGGDNYMYITLVVGNDAKIS